MTGGSCLTPSPTGSKSSSTHQTTGLQLRKQGPPTGHGRWRRKVQGTFRVAARHRTHDWSHSGPPPTRERVVSPPVGTPLLGPNTKAADLVISTLQLLTVSHHNEVVHERRTPGANWRTSEVRVSTMRLKNERERGSPLSGPTVLPWSGER